MTVRTAAGVRQMQLSSCTMRWNRVWQTVRENLETIVDMLGTFSPKFAPLKVLYWLIVSACVAILWLIAGALISAALSGIGVNPMPKYDSDKGELGELAWLFSFGLIASIAVIVLSAVGEEWNEWRRDIARLRAKRQSQEKEWQQERKER